MSQAVTWGRYGEKLRLFPNEPNVIQICPQWIKYMVTLLEGDIDWYELRSYRAALERQNKILPWYLWPQREVSDSTKRFRHVGGNPKVVHISIDKAIWFEHTLFHEVGEFLESYYLILIANLFSSHIPTGGRLELH